MYKIGIDVGSTYTKYCIIEFGNKIIDLSLEESPVRQKEYFDFKVKDLLEKYPNAEIVSCGYGKKNVLSVKCVNELIALAKGVDYIYPKQSLVLDIGGQDTKVIRQKNGLLKDFFLNNKCAAGSGMFLSNTCSALGKEFKNIKLLPLKEVGINLSSVCAVFAQSQIVELITNNIDVDMIISVVLRQILVQAKALLVKVPSESLVLSGGLSQIEGIKDYVEQILGVECIIGTSNSYLSAIGCARIN